MGSIGSDCRAVVLDIDGTLCTLNRGVGDIYAEVLASRGSVSDPNLLNSAARRVWREFQGEYLNTLEHHQTTPARERMVWLEFARRVVSAAGVQCRGQEGDLEAIYNAFGTGAYRSIEPGAIDFITKARAKGLSVCAATNNDERSKIVLRDLGLSHLLDAIFVAGELRWKKPSPNFFQAISSSLHVAAGRLLHVGNNVELDVRAAQISGWTAILYDPKGEQSESGSVRNYQELSKAIGC